MPEIAEVALMTQAIREIAMGHSLTRIQVLGGRYLKQSLTNLSEIQSHCPLNVLSVNVKGKFSWIELAGDWYITITFGMAGGIFYEPTETILTEYSAQEGRLVTRDEYMKHFHIKFEIDNGMCFYFGDSRHFGTVNIHHNRVELDKKLSKLGPDMLTGPPITDIQFIQIFRRPIFNTKNICRVLMDQQAVSGVGNYIKAEVLYQCHINPWANVSDLNDQILIHLHHAIREVAKKAFVGHGASLYTYTGTRREKGTFQDLLKVYGKKLDPEGHVVNIIHESISPDKRTTHYVPAIQTIGSHRDPNQSKKKIIIRLKTQEMVMGASVSTLGCAPVLQP